MIGTTTGTTTDARGHAQLHALPTATHQIRVSAVSFQTVTQTIFVPVRDTIHIAIETAEEALEEITVSSTHGGRSVADEPTRVEVIDREELDRKANMQPTSIAVILRERPGQPV